MMDEGPTRQPRARRLHCNAMNAVGGSTRLSRSARADEAAARRKLTNEETAALIADSLRSTLEFSPAGCALAYAVLRRATLPLRLSHRGLGLIAVRMKGRLGRSGTSAPQTASRRPR